jgi:HNH endonuclease/Transposase
VIVEQREGRRLRSDEIVHHIDGDRLNYDPTNLMILDRPEHMRIHAKAKRTRWTDAERERAVELYEAGMTIADVSVALGRSYPQTRANLARFGRSRRPQETRALAAALKAA